MNQNSVVKFTFVTFQRHSLASGARYRRTVRKTATGFETLAHAESWGHHEASFISAELREAYYLTTVFVDQKNFICAANPECYRDGVTVLESQGCQP